MSLAACYRRLSGDNQTHSWGDHTNFPMRNSSMYGGYGGSWQHYGDSQYGHHFKDCSDTASLNEAVENTYVLILGMEYD